MVKKIKDGRARARQLNCVSSLNGYTTNNFSRHFVELQIPFVFFLLALTYDVKFKSFNTPKCIKKKSYKDLLQF